MEFEIDISRINFTVNPDKLTLSEILSVHRNHRSNWEEIEGLPKRLFYSLQCGYSNKKRFLLMASRIWENKRQILRLQVANEDQIQKYYCRQ